MIKLCCIFNSDYQRFIGAWRLVHLTFADGSINPAYGENPVGYIMYSKDGIMSVQMMRRSRLNFHSDKTNEALSSETENVLKDFFAYSGHFSVDDKNKIITHHAETHIFPNDVNKDFKRSYRFEGNRLYLSVIGSKTGSTIIWEKV